jgi:hypothetical protein
MSGWRLVQPQSYPEVPGDLSMSFATTVQTAIMRDSIIKFQEILKLNVLKIPKAKRIAHYYTRQK